MDDREMITWLARKFFQNNAHACTSTNQQSTSAHLTNKLREDLDTLLWEYTQETGESIVLKKNHDEPNIMEACVKKVIAYLIEHLVPEKSIA